MKPITHAALLAAAAMLLWSTKPLTIALTQTTVNPFLYLFWYQTVFSASSLIYLLITHPTITLSKTTYKHTLSYLPTRTGLLASLNGFGILGFAAAATFVDTALVAIITGAWIILFVAYRKHHDTHNRYLKPRHQEWATLTLAATAVAIITLSQTGNLNLTTTTTQTLIGIGLAAVTALTNSWISHRLQLGAQLWEDTTHKTTEPACQIITSLITALPAGAAAATTIAAHPNLREFTAPGIEWVIATAALGAPAGILFRYSNTITTNLGINTIQYLQPLFALVWLTTFATITITRPDLLAVGTGAVIAANTLISTPPNHEHTTHTSSVPAVPARNRDRPPHHRNHRNRSRRPTIPKKSSRR